MDQVHSQESGHHVTKTPAWTATGAIIFGYLAAITQSFSGTVETLACVMSLYAVPAIVFVWLIASRR
jgi:hypothetical protein